MRNIYKFHLIFKGLMLFFILNQPLLMAQSNKLQSGPMLGYSTMREVLLWVQTNEAAQVHFVYYEKENADQRYETDKVETQKQSAFIAKCVAAVLPGKRYAYELYINDQLVERPYPLEFQSQTLWQWRTDPPNFTFAFGSCSYVNETEFDRPGKPYGGGYEIFQSIHQKGPDFMVWAGDNTYLREADWNSRAGIFHRYTHTRSLAEMQALLASTHNYAIWDDHDYGPNDSNRSFWNKEVTKEAFELFWGNPNYGLGGGVSGTFVWGDVQFFLVDDRYFRTSPNLVSDEGIAGIIGKEQMQWLMDGLVSSRATFKFVVIGGQVLNPFNEKSWIESLARYPQEREALFAAIEKNKIPGVVFLTGDRHHTELSKMDREGNYPLYDLTVSPLTAGAVGARGRSESNFLRVPETYFGERNFALLSVSGPRTERVLTIRICNGKGDEVWKRTIQASELKTE